MVILLINGKRDIGRKLAIENGSPFLKSGIISAILSRSGKTPDLNDKLIILLKITEKTSTFSLNRTTEISLIFCFEFFNDKIV